MRSKTVISIIALLVLAYLSGLAERQIAGLRHINAAHWIQLVAYVLAFPLAKLAFLSPGIITGYFFTGGRYFLIFLAACVAYIPYQFGLGSGLGTDLVALLAVALAYSVAQTVAYFAGIQLSRF
jgi:hypothetical protein